MSEDTIAKLAAIAADPAEGPLARSNALGYLGTRYVNEAQVFPILASAMDDKETLVRSLAARLLNQWPQYRSETIIALTKALSDPSRAVQIEAAVGLVSLGVRDVPGDDAGRFQSAQGLFRARMSLNSDDATQNVAAGKFYLLNADPARAVDGFPPESDSRSNHPGPVFVRRSLCGERRLENRPPNPPKYPARGRSIRTSPTAATQD